MFLRLCLLGSCAFAQADGPRYSGEVAPDRAVAPVLNGGQLRLGINRTNLPWLTGAERQLEVLRDIKRLGAENIRLAWVQPFASGYDHIAECNRLGLPVTLMIPHSELKLHYPPDVTVREKKTNLMAMPYLSQMNTEGFVADFRTFLLNLRSKGLRVEAVQPFNEVNWADFNGDLPYVEGGLIIDESNWRRHDFVKRWATGILKYGEVLQGARAAIDEVYADAPSEAPLLVMTGAGEPPASWVKHAGGTLVMPEIFYGILSGAHPLNPEKTNYLAAADALAVHLYPEKGDLDPQTAMATAKDAIRKKIDPLFAAAGAERPVYITEFGYNGWQWGNRERDEYKRLLNTRILLNALCDPQFADVRFGPVQFFDYDHMPPFSIYEEGILHPSAVIFQERYFFKSK